MNPARTLAALAAAALLPATLAAQADSTRLESPSAPVYTNAVMRPLAAGDTVRVISAAGRYRGTLKQVGADTLTLAAPGRTDAVLRTDVSEMHRLVSRESRGRSIIRGAGFGVLAGAALGFGVGTVAGRQDCPPADRPCTPGGHDATARAAFTADGAILGALVGAMLGPTFRRSRWERVDAAPSPRVEVAPAAGGGVSGSVEVRF